MLLAVEGRRGNGIEKMNSGQKKKRTKVQDIGAPGHISTKSKQPRAFQNTVHVFRNVTVLKGFSSGLAWID